MVWHFRYDVTFQPFCTSTVDWPPQNYVTWNRREGLEKAISCQCTQENCFFSLLSLKTRKLLLDTSRAQSSCEHMQMWTGALKPLKTKQFFESFFLGSKSNLPGCQPAWTLDRTHCHTKGGGSLCLYGVLWELKLGSMKWHSWPVS